MSIEKKSKESVNYTPHAQRHDQRCALCEHFIASAAQCHRVKGHISAQGWCELFKRAA